MTDKKKREAYKKWLKDKCNNDFLNEEGVEELPFDIELAIEQLMKMDANNEVGIESKAKGQIDTKFADKIPTFVIEVIANHRKMKWW